MLLQSFAAQFEKLAKDHSLTLPIRCVLGCSGGLDSRVLLHLLVSVSPQMVELRGVMHVNHNLRETSKRDAFFVEELCTLYKVPYVLLDVSPCKHDVTNEAWGREIRYAYFEEQRQKLQADVVITAHHGDDEIETFFFKLITGRNNYDLSFISPYDKERNVLRPFLGFYKNEILEYAKSQSLEFVEDETNYESVASRNIIRNEIMPHFDTLNSNYRSHITEFLELLKSEKRYLKSIAYDTQTENVSEILKLPMPIALRVLNEKAKKDLPQDFHLIPVRKYSQLLLHLESQPEGLSYFEMGADLKAAIDLRSHVQQIKFVRPDQIVDLRLRQDRHKEFFLKIGLEEEVVFLNKASDRKYLLGVTTSGHDVVIERLTCTYNVSEENIDCEDFRLSCNKKLEFYVSGECTFDRISSSHEEGSRSVAKLIKNSKLSTFDKKALIYISQDNELLWVPSVCKSFAHQKCDNMTGSHSILMYLVQLDS